MNEVAVYGRVKGARSYTLVGLDVAEEAVAIRRGAYRNFADVVDFPVSRAQGVPFAVKTADIKTTERQHAAKLAEDAAPRAAEALAGAVVPYAGASYVKVETGTDYGLALAVRNLAQSRGTKAHVVSMFEVFAGTPARYEVTIG